MGKFWVEEVSEISTVRITEENIREGITEARVMVWILQLEPSDIPGALEFIIERERSRYGDEPSEKERQIGEEMEALLARWYELDGEDGGFGWSVTTSLDAEGEWIIVSNE